MTASIHRGEATELVIGPPSQSGWRDKIASFVATIVVAATVAASAANAESRRVQVGTLTCSLSASIGLIVGSQRNVSCLFRRVNRMSLIQGP